MRLIRVEINGAACGELCQLLSKHKLDSLDVIQNVTAGDKGLFAKLTREIFAPPHALAHIAEKVAHVLTFIWGARGEINLNRNRGLDRPCAPTDEPCKNKFTNFGKYLVSDLILSRSEDGLFLRKKLSHWWGAIDLSDGSPQMPEVMKTSEERRDRAGGEPQQCPCRVMVG